MLFSEQTNFVLCNSDFFTNSLDLTHLWLFVAFFFITEADFFLILRRTSLYSIIVFINLLLLLVFSIITSYFDIKHLFPIKYNLAWLRNTIFCHCLLLWPLLLFFISALIYKNCLSGLCHIRLFSLFWCHNNFWLRSINLGISYRFFNFVF